MVCLKQDQSINKIDSTSLIDSLSMHDGFNALSNKFNQANVSGTQSLEQEKKNMIVNLKSNNKIIQTKK